MIFLVFLTWRKGEGVKVQGKIPDVIYGRPQSRMSKNVREC